MVTIFVLDVEEFRPLVEVARLKSHVDISAGPAGYTRIQASDELEFRRKELGLKPAVWYGALTGGVIGRVVEFSRDTLRIRDDGRPPDSRRELSEVSRGIQE